MREHNLEFRAMGCSIRVLAGPPASGSADPAGEQSAMRVRKFIESFDADLSRFSPASELCRLNSSPDTEVRVSGLLASLVSAAVWAARESGGLLDPTLVEELEAVGYARTLSEATPAPLAEALKVAPARHPARPRRLNATNEVPDWREIKVADRLVSRPPGVRIDSGGVGKGLAADAAAQLLADRSRFCVSAGGDLRIGGPDAAANPYPVPIEDPFSGDPLTTLSVGSGAIATSGIGSRIWQNPDGSFSHHLLDPSTGRPAWTGLLQVTAAAPTALEAETIAKRVLLGGPKAVGLLERHGGVVLDDGQTVELFGGFARTAMSSRTRTLAVGS